MIGFSVWAIICLENTLDILLFDFSVTSDEGLENTE